MNWRASKNRLYVLIYTFYILDELFLLRTNIVDLLTETGVSLLSMGCKAAIYGLLAVYVTQFMQIGPRRFLVMAALLGAFAVSTLSSHATTMLQTLVLVLCFCDADMDRIARQCVWLMAAIAAATVFLAVAGLITNKVKDRQVFEAVRLSYGFRHANTLAQLGFQLSAAFLYLKRKKRSMAKFLVPLAVTLACFYTSYSLAGAAVSLLLIGASFVAECLERGKKLPRRLLLAAVVVALAVILLIIVHYWRNPFEIGNQIKSLRVRFTYSKRYIRAYGIHPFGRRIAIGSQVQLPGYKIGYGYLDNGYIRILVESGALVFALFMYFQLAYLRRLIRGRQALLCIIQICFMIYGFLEYKALTVMFNVFLLNIGIMLSRAPDTASARRPRALKAPADGR